MKAIFHAAMLLLAGIGTSGCYAQNGEASAQSSTSDAAQSQLSEAGLRLASLSIRSGDATHKFTVEVARTAAEQAQGLMFRTELAPDRGMIFPFAEDRVASFWMKNTVIGLDIIFVRRDGTIESIAANTVPYSLESVRSGEAVGAVLELAGGRAAELSLKPGDMVEWTQ